MSRPMKDSEKAEVKKSTGKDVKEFIVAYDGVAMVVHKDNPVTELTMAQLAQIFKGEITNWKDLGGADATIVVLSRDTASGTHVFIKEHVLGNAEYGSNVQFLTSNQAIYSEVKGNSQAIGYIGLGYLDDAVKALAVKKDDSSAAVLPTVATVKDKTYVVSRPLYNYTAGDPSGLVKTYLDFVMGTEGQAIVADLGFVPVK
jgi:phosphate transport system substrate-binding protein